MPKEPNYKRQDPPPLSPDGLKTEGGLFYDYISNGECEVCFYPVNAGELCPKCQETAREIARIVEQASEGPSFFDIINGQATHVFGVGYVLPGTREGARHLDD